jgi:hypothetical protein
MVILVRLSDILGYIEAIDRCDQDEDEDR